MPELPEVETVRRGLMPWMEGARIEKVLLHRPNLRFAFPERFAERLEGQRIEQVARRAKYLLFHLSSGALWLGHLGMTGSFRFAQGVLAEPSRYHAAAPGHDHVTIGLTHPSAGALQLIYADPRRFGFMDLTESADISPYLRDLGPEPLSNGFNTAGLAASLAGRKAPIKAMLLDQAVVAGLGNIYVSEALYRAHIRPDRPAGSLSEAEIGLLVLAVRAVLDEAIEAGGSTLKDFRNAEGGSGYFQHWFDVYDREGQLCPTPGCAATVARIVQSGRSSFFCPSCQH